MIDTHNHIYSTEFDADRADVINSAKNIGVNKILMPNIDSASINSMMDVYENYPDLCLPMIGLHPCSVKNNFDNELKLVKEYLEKHDLKFYGIGETGLDYYWDLTYREQQKLAFQFQIDMAKEYHLPIIIHSRDSIDDCIEMIQNNYDENLQGIFHCFSGTAEQLQSILDINFFIGIGGVVTFKNGGLDKILKPQHLSNILLETDSPYLAPVPYRGKRNEPSYLKYIINKLAEILEISSTKIIEQTTLNAKTVFNLN